MYCSPQHKVGSSGRIAATTTGTHPSTGASESMTLTTPTETFIEAVIFGSYVVISYVVLYIYYRHKAYLDSFVNRLLAVNFGFFLMLCAITHV